MNNKLSWALDKIIPSGKKENMGCESHRRMRDETKHREARFARKEIFRAILPFIGVALVAVGIFALVNSRQYSQKLSEIVDIQSPSFKRPETLKELLALSPSELDHCDIARMNLLCAEGLPGAENLNVDELVAALDQWARHIKFEIDRNFHRYWEDPAYFYNSTNFYKMAMMGVVLYEDYNIRYNPKWIGPPGSERPDDHFFADASDVLIHGLIGDRHLGTCSSMPVLYMALGRRLGYPLKLVTTRRHLFIRWDSPTEKFNMDATSKGVNHYDDSVYRQWPFSISDEEINKEGYLKSLSSVEELSVFMSIRGMCQTDNGFFADAAESFKTAYRLQPNWKGNQVLLAHA